MLKVTNTLTGKKEEFKSLVPGHVKMYVCGITPYDYSHIGHARVYVTFDLLYRLLIYLGYQVSYCRNFTDIDCKIIKKAEAEFGSRLEYAKIAQRFIDAYHHDMRALNCTEPTHEPRVTETIEEIITFVQGLVEAGKAYAVGGDVYFAIDQFPEYGQLSKQNLDELVAGARVDPNEKKRHPLDFALWKAEPEGQFWKSPWGYGRPGWHIECSAMAAKFLGKQIDIHAGGLDLIFPHHENEIAQSQGLYEQPFARYWMHNGFVTVNKEKMSKSLGNFFTLRDVFKQYDPMVIRDYIVAHHYKAPLEFSPADIDAVQKSYNRLSKFLSRVQCERITPADVAASRVASAMLSFLCDDLNTPGMFGVVFENLPLLEDDHDELCAVKYVLQNIVGLTLEPLAEREVTITQEMQQLINEREQARVEKNWARADALRDQLKALGYDVQDKKALK